MDIRYRELSGRSGALNTSQTQHKHKYQVWDADGTATVLQMRAHLLSEIPLTVDSYCGIDSLDWDEDERPGHYVFTAGYSSRQLEATLRIGWDSTGGTVRMTTSRGTQAYARSGLTAPNFHNSIGVRDGDPEGVDVVIPSLKLNFTYKWPAGVIDLAYVKAMAGMVGKTNDNSWYTFAAGELLFLGSTGEIDPTASTEIQYHFAASANVSGLSIGQISNVAKGGHQYLWVSFDQATDQQRIVQRPRACYVETVYGSAPFNTFGIGS